VENDLKDFQKENPNTPIGKFIEETIMVPEHKFNPETGRMTIVNKLEKQKTMYIHAPKEKIRCKAGEHSFICLDNHKYIFGCTKCSYKRIVYPVKYRYDRETKSLINRFTGEKI
jgi:hypothetical protein